MDNNSIPEVKFPGVIKIGDMHIECVVLEDGTRAYIQKQLVAALGFIKNRRGTEALPMLRTFAPNYLKTLEKTDVPMIAKMKHGGRAKIYPAGILAELTINVLAMAANNSLHHKQKHLLPNCIAIATALAKTGETALIDEATGYQYIRESHALQDLFSRIIREECSDWERRFTPEYYQALFALLGRRYTGEREKPPIIGKWTAQWVYEAVFPFPIVKELRERRDDNQGQTKLHQWLRDGGLSLLEKQIHAVTMIAMSSINADDFTSRCQAAFFKRDQYKMFLA